MKILVVDDEKDIVENICTFLSKKGYAADSAYDGEKARALIEESKYDLVFLDYNMPGLTGLEVIEFVKKNNLDTRTVIVTAYPDMEEFFAKRLGADEYVTKPYSLQKIEQIVEKYKK